jgi:cytochrome c peroxidase
MEVHMSFLKLYALAAPLALALVSIPAQAQTTPAQLIAGFVAQSGQPAQAARGQEFFTSKHGKDWSCSTCHTAKPTVDGKHATTGKVITPMAPAVNPQRFTDVAKTEKWFRRNCNDVVGRECSPAEKADMLTWLASLKS